jgi:hypothetical protein
MPTTNPNYWRDYYRRNRRKILAYHKRWLKQHPGYSLNYVRAWQKRNPERWRKLKATKDLKHVFKKRFGGHREEVIKRDGEQCQLCGMTRKQHRKQYGRDIVVDHIDGMGRGYKRPNNNITNLRTLCLVCNLKVAREATLSTKHSKP